MEAITIPPSTQLVTVNTGTKAEVILLRGTGIETMASAVNDTLAAVLSAPWKVPLARHMALLAVLFTQSKVVGLTSQDVSRTDDGGLVLEFTSKSGRELLFAIPEDARAMFFVAEENGERLAGAVPGPSAAARLAEWLAGAPFPMASVKLG